MKYVAQFLLPHLDSKSFTLGSYICPHVVVVLPKKSDFTMKMLCMHHIIPSQYIHSSGGFYSRLISPDHGGNRTTRFCLGTFLTPLVMTVCYTRPVAYKQKHGNIPRETQQRIKQERWLECNSRRTQESRRFIK